MRVKLNNKREFKLNIFTNDKKQKITGFIAGIVFLAISLFWINYTGYWVKMGDIQISGPLWAVLGFLIGLIFSTKKHSENRF